MVKRTITGCALAIILFGCAGETVKPGTACVVGDETCSEGQTCVGFGCFFSCDVEGDCDPDFHCFNGSCFQSCTESEEVCEFPFACSVPDAQREIRACLPTRPTPCTVDDQCRGVCNRGTCTVRCEQNNECSGGFCGVGERDFDVCLNRFF